METSELMAAIQMWGLVSKDVMAEAEATTSDNRVTINPAAGVF